METIYIIGTECYHHIFWATEYWTLGLFPPRRRAVFGMIYTKRKKGEGVFPPFRGELKGGFEIVVTTFLQWNWDSSELGYFHETKTARSLCQNFSLLSTYFKPIPGFRERDLTCCLQRKIEFYCGIGLNKIRRSGLESGLDVAFWGGTQ